MRFCACPLLLLLLVGCGSKPPNVQTNDDSSVLKEQVERLTNRLAELEKADNNQQTVETKSSHNELSTVEPFETSDASGHLVSRGFRIQRADGNYARTGRWTFYLANGMKESDGEFANDVKTGRWTYYIKNKHRGEELVDLIDYQEDYVDGAAVYRITYLSRPRNIPRGEGPRRNGKSVGEHITYYSTGERLSLAMWREDGLIVSWTMFRKDGRDFATYGETGYVLKGIPQSELPPRHESGAHFYDWQPGLAWEDAIRQLWAEEGK